MNPTTNAEHHVITNRGAGWRFAGFRRRCDRYFGEVDGCTGLIRTGDPIFNTGVSRFPGLLHTGAPARHAMFAVCEACARAPRSAEPAERAA